MRFPVLFVQNKTIKAYPWDTIVKLNKGEASRDPDVVCSIAFSTFNEVSVKSKVMFGFGFGNVCGMGLLFLLAMCIIMLSVCLILPLNCRCYRYMRCLEDI